MNFMRRIILLLAAASAVHSAPAQTPETERQLIAARDTVWRAFFRNDTTLLRRFLPPAVATFEGSPAHWNDRRNIIDGSRGFAQSARLVDLKFINTQISQSGHTALVRSNYTTVIEAGGRRDTTGGRATELFVRVGNTWMNPYWQLEPSAQRNDAGRDIDLPDTLGANFSIADSASKLGTPTDYDFLVGTWEFRFQSRKSDGTFYPVFTGHWTFDKKPDGGLIEDRWRPDDPSAPMGSSLYTYRSFDPRRMVWQMYGMTSRPGAVQPGLTWADANNRYAVQRGNDGMSRIRYLAISAEHFLWRSDRSIDGGKTWLLDAGTMSATRIGK